MKTSSSIVVLIAVAAVSLAGVVGGAEDEPPALRVHTAGRFLTTENGRPAFLLCDTAWSLATRVSREDAEAYLKKRRDQQFNAVTFVLFTRGNNDLGSTDSNHYGHAPFKIVNGRPDPTQPDVQPGPDNDFWDHVDWLVALTRRLGFHAIILPTWGSGVAGSYNGKDVDGIVFNQSNAYAYGRWLGERFESEPHLVWMLGGDRRAVYGEKDYRPVFQAMAEGLGDGSHGIDRHDGKADFSGLLMSFHPPKKSPQSSDWFHHDGWLSFNSIQHWPEDQQKAIEHDWSLAPPKPTWVFETRYEGYGQRPNKTTDWGEWQMRQQAWQSVLAGGFGFTYGHERVFGFGADGSDWTKELDAPGANQMRNLVKLMSLWSEEDYFERVPDQSLLDGNEGVAERLKSNRITATRNAAATLAMIYSGDGSGIRLKMDRLAGKKITASWFNPRTGNWRVGDAEFDQPTSFANDLNGGAGAKVREFVPPGGRADGNDWLLILDAR